MVSTDLYPTRVTVVAGDALVAEHERLPDKSMTRYNWQHYIPLVQRKRGASRNGAPFTDPPQPLQRLRRALLRESGGDRLMARVLALVPTAGLEAVAGCRGVGAGRRAAVGARAHALEAGVNRTPPMQDRTLVDALDNATSLELFQLSMLAERLLTGPRRILALRRLLHLGQLVRFYDWKHDQMRTARIVQMKDTRVLLQETGTRVHWTLPYAAIEPPAPGQEHEAATPPPHCAQTSSVATRSPLSIAICTLESASSLE